MVKPGRVLMNLLKNIVDHETIWIPLKDGCRLAARVWLPDDAEQHPVPAILEYLPYRRRDGTIVRDELTHPYIAARGYACVRVDMRGSGDSDGLLFDEYALQEQLDALEVIDWIVSQPWCSGSVGMMGISWGGFNALQVAAHKPKALKAIITLCSTADRYATDIHYKGGALLLENLGWASTFFAYQSRPPDPAVVGESWREMWLNRLEHLPLFIKTWLEHQGRDDYWKHGSICEDYSSIEAATLAVGGWCDAYSNTVFRLIENIKAPVRGLVGPWAHKYPHFAIPKPQIGFLQEALRWWDKWLKGIETGVMDDPLLKLYRLDSYPPKSHYEELKGEWLAFEEWPSPHIQHQVFHLSKHQLSKVPTHEQLQLYSPETTGTQAGEFCIIWLGPEWPLDQRPDDAGSLCFDRVLEHDLDIIGAAKIHLKLKSQTSQANLSVRLCDVAPNGESTRITYGILNLCQHNSAEFPEALPIDEWIQATITLDEIAYQIPKGHTLRLSISSSYFPLIWPAKESVWLEFDLSECRLEFPVLQTKPNQVLTFPPVESALAADIEVLRPNSNQRFITKDMVAGKTNLNIIDDYGKRHIKRYDLITETYCKELYSIKENDPLSATAKTFWREYLERGDWIVCTETTTYMSCDKDFFYLTANLKAFESETIIFEKNWQEKIKREFV
jgi:hypothetical protein